MLKLAAERVLQFKCLDPEGQSYRTLGKRVGESAYWRIGV